MKENKASIILNTSANLLGFCLVVITSLHIAHFTAGHFVDELTLLIALLLVTASLFSFLSLRSTNETLTKRYENRAGFFFFASLIGILFVMLLITVDLLN